MRRILLMLPVLALVACQTDTPTDPGSLQTGEYKTHPPLPETRIILDDASVDTPFDSLEFYVVNPGLGMPPCDPWNSFWGIYVDNRGHWIIHIENGALGERCTDEQNYWPLYTNDSVPDLRLSVNGYNVCDHLMQYNEKHVVVSFGLTTPELSDTVFTWKTFLVKCPFYQK